MPLTKSPWHKDWKQLKVYVERPSFHKGRTKSLGIICCFSLISPTLPKDLYRITKFMAKLKQWIESDEESLPDISTVLNISKNEDRGASSVNQILSESRRTSKTIASNTGTSLTSTNAIQDISHELKKPKSQRRLKPRHVNALLEPIPSSAHQSPIKDSRKLGKDSNIVELSARKNPKRTARQKVVCKGFDWGSDERDGSDFLKEDSADDLSDFIVNDSASEAELRRPPRSVRKCVEKPLKRLYQRPKKETLTSDEKEDDLSSARFKQGCQSRRSTEDFTPSFPASNILDFHLDGEPDASLRLYELSNDTRL